MGGFGGQKANDWGAQAEYQKPSYTSEEIQALLRKATGNRTSMPKNEISYLISQNMLSDPNDTYN